MVKARSKKFGRGVVIILFTALACVGTWAVSQRVRNVENTSAAAKMTAKTKTVCVGRYLVDVPEQANINLSGEMIAGFRIKTVEETEPDFHARLATREAELRARPANGDQGSEGGLIEARNLRIPRVVGRSLIYGRSRGYLMAGEKRIDMESVSVEVHVHMGDLSFSLSAEGTEEASAKEAEALLERLRPRGEDEIPTVPGFCIWRGVFVEPLPEHKNEHAVFHLGLPGHPDIGLALSSIAGGHTDEGLLARAAVTDAEATPDETLRVTKLRSGKRSMNGIEGEEVLERVRELNFTTTYGFMWEAQGVSDDPLQANLLLNMETGTNPRPGGKPIGSSLHEDAVMKLWDSISSSIRLRKTDAPPPADVTPKAPTPKLEAQATAGEVCPQTGWWKCREGGHGVDVQGGTVQWIRKGDLLPQALLLPRQTETIQRRSIWQLVRHAEGEGVALLADAVRETKGDAAPTPVGPSTLA